MISDLLTKNLSLWWEKSSSETKSTFSSCSFLNFRYLPMGKGQGQRTQNLEHGSLHKGCARVAAHPALEGDHI